MATWAVASGALQGALHARQTMAMRMKAGAAAAARRRTSLAGRRRRMRCRALDAAPGDDEPRSGGGRSDDKSNQYRKDKTRRGRPAHKRSVDDSPQRDGNRDRLMGLLTERATHTLRHYLLETSPPICKWWDNYIKEHPIPLRGEWDEVSGDAFVRELLRAPDEDFDPFDRKPGEEAFARDSYRVSPREMGERVLSVRAHLSKEFIQDLQGVYEDNQALLREILMDSFDLDAFVDDPQETRPHSGLLKQPAQAGRQRGVEGVPRSRGGGRDLAKEPATDEQ
uniref:Uncharacterized protein n=1 Tax=Prasinoderma singulare TaxID=676789 RepID=A0A7S3BQ12_9VIRI|mmetsp:Transcript_2214/g.6568  ORF Transcript_2214/g.6568 Transcript_2214/m.6568 type:complete len:281 (+) Transcript_2214:174-1016(+)